MDLSSLNSSLPPDLADAERDMGDKFRAAALSITTLYKGSLGYTKQAYQVGYSAALADMLSTVQSYIGSGEDAGLSLSRLMDWAEARQTAMATFEAEDDDIPPPRTRPTTVPHLQPARPASAPVLIDRPGPSRHVEEDNHLPASAPNPISVTLNLNTPDSSTTVNNTSPASPLAQPRALSRGRPRGVVTVSSDAATQDDEPGTLGKRTLGDTEMALDEPTTPARSRAAKRRSMAGALGKIEPVKAEDDGDRERRRRRGGPGVGA